MIAMKKDSTHTYRKFVLSSQVNVFQRTHAYCLNVCTVKQQILTAFD